jgi:hypothetical protein
LDVQGGDVNTSGSYRIGGNVVLQRVGTNNVFVAGAGNTSLTGSLNYAQGISALSAITSGDYNVALGSNALNRSTTGDWNVSLGTNSLSFNTTGSGNVAIGASALNNASNSNGSYNTAIGNGADVGANNLQNATAIGTHSRVDQSDSLVLGCVNGTNGCSATTKVGIGTATPRAQLDVAGWVPSAALDSVAIGSQPTSVAVQGHYAYVTNQASSTLQVIDISDPANLTSVSTVSTSTWTTSIAVQSHYAYVVNETSSKFQIFDISDPSNPTSVSNVTTDSYPFYIVVQGRYAYIANYGADTLQIFDISDPSKPVSVGDVATGTDPYSLAVQGRYAYVTNYTSSTLQIFDISDPTTPTSVSSIAAGTNPDSVTVQGRYAYVITRTSQTLQIFDISDPTTPASVSSVSTGGSAPGFVTVQGRYAYVLNGSSNSLKIFDISDPTTPTSVGSITTGLTPHSVAIQGRYAYVVSNASTLQSFDLGGTYAQSLEAGTLEASNVAIQQALSVNQSASIAGGLMVGQGAEISGDLGVDGSLAVTGQMILRNSTNTNTVAIQAGTTSSSYAITLPSAIGTAGQCVTIASVVGSTQTLGYGSCGGGGGGGTQTVTLVPEFAGATFKADGTSNTGFMTSNHVGGLSSGEGYKHNFYAWSTDQATAQDYDIVTEYQLPSSFSNFTGSTWKMWVYGDNAGDVISYTIKDAAEHSCATGSFTTTTTGSWSQQTLSTSGLTTSPCSYAANDVITIDFNLSSASSSSTSYIKLGEVSFTYN